MWDKRLLKLVPDAGRHVALQVLWQWGSLWSSIVMIFGISLLVRDLDQGNSLSWALYLLLGTAATAGRLLFTRLAGRESFQSSAAVKEVLRRRIYEKLLALGPAYRTKVRTGEVVQETVEGVEQLETFFGGYLPQLFYALLAPLTLFFVLLPVEWHAALVLFLGVPLIPITLMTVQSIAKRLLGRYWSIYSGLGDHFLENLQGLTTLKIYQADQARQGKMNEEAEAFRKITMKVLIMQLNSIIVMDIIALGGAALGMLMGLNGISRGRVDLAGGIFIILLSADFFIPMRQLGSLFHVAMNGMTAARRIFALLDMEEPPARNGLLGKGGFEARGLTFRYAPGKNALENVSFNVQPGQFIGIAGESGCGKSTLAGLLTGRLEGYEGELTLGGAEISAINSAILQRTVVTVSWDEFLFSGTVKETLAMGNPQATKEEMWDALDKVDLGSTFRNKEGLSTVLVEQGANLSGGQRQRLALARALLTQASCFILDEATSNIDPKSEAKILEAIHGMVPEKTVFFISHRLKNLVDADQILVLEKGKLVGVGMHTMLLTGCKTYQCLWEKQQTLEMYTERGKERAEVDK